MIEQERIRKGKFANQEELLINSDLNKIPKPIKDISSISVNSPKESAQITVKNGFEEIKKPQKIESVISPTINIGLKEKDLSENNAKPDLKHYQNAIDNRLKDDTCLLSKKEVDIRSNNQNSLSDANYISTGTNNFSVSKSNLANPGKIDLDENHKNINDSKIKDSIILNCNNKGNEIKISNRIIHNFGNGIFHTFLIKQMNSDFESQIRIIKSFNGTGIGIGLYSGDEKFLKQDELLGYQQEGYSYWMFSGMKCNKRVNVPYSDPYMESDIIGIIFKNGNLEFMRNSQNLGLAFSNIKTPVYISVCSQYNGDEFEVVEIKDL